MNKKIFAILLTLGAMLLVSSCMNTNSPTPDPEPEPVVADSLIETDVAMFKNEIWDYKESPDHLAFKGNTVVIVDFSATWCGPCKMAAPILKKLAKEYAGTVRIYSVDVDAQSKAGKNREIYRAAMKIFDEFNGGVPAFIKISRNGKRIQAQIGYHHGTFETTMRDFIEQNK